MERVGWFLFCLVITSPSFSTCFISLGRRMDLNEVVLVFRLSIVHKERLFSILLCTTVSPFLILFKNLSYLRNFLYAVLNNLTINNLSVNDLYSSYRPTIICSYVSLVLFLLRHTVLPQSAHMQGSTLSFHWLKSASWSFWLVNLRILNVNSSEIVLK